MPLQQFDSLEAKVTKKGDRIHVRNGRTSGQSIGLTTQGCVDLGSDTAQLRGVVVPAFALNNLLSNVPLLGPLLTGGKDGGLFAISYQLQGPLDDLKTNINMMSAVTPGALREMFTAPPDDGERRIRRDSARPNMPRAPPRLDRANQDVTLAARRSLSVPDNRGRSRPPGPRRRRSACR